MTMTMGSPAGWRLEGFTACPSLLSPHLVTRQSRLQEDHFLLHQQRLWVRQKRSWEKRINTSSFQLGLEIRAQGDEAEASLTPGKIYLGHFKEDSARN